MGRSHGKGYLNEGKGLELRSYQNLRKKGKRRGKKRITLLNNLTYQDGPRSQTTKVDKWISLGSKSTQNQTLNPESLMTRQVRTTKHGSSRDLQSQLYYPPHFISQRPTEEDEDTQLLKRDLSDLSKANTRTIREVQEQERRTRSILASKSQQRVSSQESRGSQSRIKDQSR